MKRLDKDIQSDKHEIDNHYHSKAKGAIFRSKSRWFKEGEKKYKIFFQFRNDQL